VTGARFTRRGIAAAIVVAAVVGAGAIVAIPAFAPTSVSMEQSGVRVEIVFSGADRGEVVAVFRPLDAGFHLYGPDLPREGIDGAGRPTLLELAPDSAWHATGNVIADPETTLLSLPSFDRPFPVFPDGPVTLRLPIERDAAATGAHGDTVLTVSVTYMACSSSGRCLAPVIDQALTVPIRP
jgi:hypothetical protein